MPIKIYPPTERNRTETPADGFLAAPEMLILGVTYPTYFDKVIDDPECKIRSPLPIAAAPQSNVEEKGRKFETNYNLTLIASPKQVFSWIVELPPNPLRTRWISARTKSAQEIATLIRNVNKTTVTPLDAAQGNYHLELLCQPSSQSFYDHVRNHEMQHVADFNWLIGAIFGRWVAWRDELARNGNCGFTVRNLDTFKWILAGGDFGDGDPQDYLIAYLEATRNTGSLFHKTAKGAGPVIRFQRIVQDAVYGPVAQFDISASLSMANDNVAYDSLPHAKFAVPSVYEIVSEHTEVAYSGLLNHQLPTGSPAVTQAAIEGKERSGQFSLNDFF